MKLQLATVVLWTAAAPVAAQWLSLPTPGIPRTADGAPDLSAPAPRTEFGNPDLTGLWRNLRVRGDLSDPGKLQPWAAALAEERFSRFSADRPRYHCLPSGPENITSVGNAYGLRRIVQHPTIITMLYNDMTYREVFLDGRELEPDPLPTWTGYSVGRWRAIHSWSRATATTTSHG